MSLNNSLYKNTIKILTEDTGIQRKVPIKIATQAVETKIYCYFVYFQARPLLCEIQAIKIKSSE